MRKEPKLAVPWIHANSEAHWNQQNLKTLQKKRRLKKSNNPWTCGQDWGDANPGEIKRLEQMRWKKTTTKEQKRTTHAEWQYPGGLVNDIIAILLSETQCRLSADTLKCAAEGSLARLVNGATGKNKTINQDWMDGVKGRWWRWRRRMRRQGGRLHEVCGRETGCGCQRRQQVCDRQTDGWSAGWLWNPDDTVIREARIQRTTYC